jgi:ribosome maturation factor RimP
MGHFFLRNINRMQERLRQLAEEACVKASCWLYDLEVVGAHNNRTLRVSIDRDDQPVGVEDCEMVSRALSEALDAEDVVEGGQYLLEVSSPGIERNLREPRHYTKALGQVVMVKSFAPMGQFVPDRQDLSKQRQVKGKLISFDIEDGVRVEDAKGVVHVPAAQIAKAHTVFEMNVAKPGRR